MNLLDFEISQLFTCKEVNFLHLDDALWNSIFPFLDLTLENQFIGQTVSDDKSSLSSNLIVDGLAIPFVNESWVDFLEFSLGGENFLSEHETNAYESSIRLALTL